MATVSLEETAAQIEQIAASTRLPTLPEVAMRLLEIARQEEPDFDEVCRVIRSDPAICGKILKTVNSALFGFRTKIETVEQAVPALGLSMIRTLVLSFHLADQQRGHSALDGRLPIIWRSCLTQAVLAELIGERSGVDAPTAFMAGLLQDIGILAMLAERPTEYIENVLRMAPLPNTTAAERAQFGFSHVDVSAAIVKKWNVGPEFSAAICHHHDRVLDSTQQGTRSLTKVLQAAHLGTVALFDEPIAPTWLDDALKHWLLFMEQELGLGADDAEELISEVQPRVQEYAAMFQFNIGDDISATSVIRDAKELLNEIAIENQVKLLKSEKTRKAKRIADDELYRDWLSGAHNRRYMSDCLSDAMATWIVKRKPIAMLFLDVDKFKSINDTHGHKVGDQAIKHVAQWLSSATRKNDIVIRLGGDEFLIIMQIAKRQCDGVIQRVAREFPPLPLAGGGSLQMSLSAGCVFYRPKSGDSQDANWLIDEADQLMYEVKRDGGDNVTLREVTCRS